jgi:hypothetical protein
MLLNLLCYMLGLLTLSQFIKAVLFGKGSINEGDAGGRRPSNHVLWGTGQTTPGMIAAAATIVCL